MCSVAAAAPTTLYFKGVVTSYNAVESGPDGLVYHNDPGRVGALVSGSLTFDQANGSLWRSDGASWSVSRNAVAGCTTGTFDAGSCTGAIASSAPFVTDYTLAFDGRTLHRWSDPAASFYDHSYAEASSASGAYDALGFTSLLMRSEQIGGQRIDRDQTLQLFGDHGRDLLDEGDDFALPIETLRQILDTLVFGRSDISVDCSNGCDARSAVATDSWLMAADIVQLSYTPFDAPQEVPEPGTVALLGLGLAGIVGAGRLRRPRAA